MPAIQQIVNPLPVLEQSLQVTRAVHYPNQDVATQRSAHGSERGKEVGGAAGLFSPSR
jgi:hypothetical protein